MADIWPWGSCHHWNVILNLDKQQENVCRVASNLKNKLHLPIKVPFVTFGPWYEGVGADFSVGSHAAQHWCEHGELRQSCHLPVGHCGKADLCQPLSVSMLSWSGNHSLSSFNKVRWSCAAALMSLSTVKWFPSLNWTHSAPRTLTSCLQTLISFLSICQNKADHSPAFLHLPPPPSPRNVKHPAA